MRTSPLLALVISGALLSAPALGADAPVTPPEPAVPYDAPAPAAPMAVPPAPPPAAAPQAADQEAPRRAPAPVVAQEPAAAEPPVANPSEAPLVFVESLVGFLALDGTIAIAAGAENGWILLAGPLATGGVVCLLGSASSYYDGSCGAAIGGSYLGSLLLFPMAFLLSRGSGENALTGLIVGAALGYVVGTTVGAVVGWNVSRVPKRRVYADAPRLDAVAAARAAPWSEPLRPRGSLLEGSAPQQLTAPVLAFRF